MAVVTSGNAGVSTGFTFPANLAAPFTISACGCVVYRKAYPDDCCCAQHEPGKKSGVEVFALMDGVMVTGDGFTADAGLGLL